MHELQTTPKARRLLWVLVMAGWVPAVAGGFAALATYEIRPGPVAETPPTWPEGARIEREGGRWTLLVFVHPQCPCTRASLEALDRLLARGGEDLALRLIFCDEASRGSSWCRSATWERARRLPGAVLVEDQGAVLARGFAARTSGQAMLYDAEGRLRFSGGLTASRGHDADGAGVAAILACVRGGDVTVERTPVFGCELLAETVR